MLSVKWKFNDEQQAVTVISLSERSRRESKVTTSLSEDMKDITVQGVAD